MVILVFVFVYNSSDLWKSQYNINRFISKNGCFLITLYIKNSQSRIHNVTGLSSIQAIFLILSFCPYTLKFLPKNLNIYINLYFRHIKNFIGIRFIYFHTVTFICCFVLSSDNVLPLVFPSSNCAFN